MSNIFKLLFTFTNSASVLMPSLFILFPISDNSAKLQSGQLRYCTRALSPVSLMLFQDKLRYFIDLFQQRAFPKAVRPASLMRFLLKSRSTSQIAGLQIILQSGSSTLSLSSVLLTLIFFKVVFAFILYQNAAYGIHFKRFSLINKISSFVLFASACPKTSSEGFKSGCMLSITK